MNDLATGLVARLLVFLSGANRRNRRPATAGFTLTELLVVCAVIIILISLLLVCIDGLYSYAIQAKCQHHLEQIWNACLMYASSNQGMYPQSWNYETGKAWNEQLVSARYLDSDAVIGCPATEMIKTAGTATVTSPVTTGVNTVILDVLRWFKSKQNLSNGSWWPPPETPTYTCPDGSHNSASHTGFALLAYFGAGITDAHPEFGDTVKRGVEFLASSAVQNKQTGAFPCGFYTQGIATMALCEAYRLMQDPGLKQTAHDAAELGLGYLRNPPLGHAPPFVGGYVTYTSCNDDGTDNSITSFCEQALAAGLHAGLTVTSADVANVLNRLDRAFYKPGRAADEARLTGVGGTDNGGRDSYGTLSTYLGATPYKRNHWNLVNNFWRQTAATLTCRLLFGQKPTDTDVLTQANWLVSHDHLNHITVQDWYSPNPGHRQIYYTWYTTVAMYLMGDTPSQHYWSDWEAVYVPKLLDVMVTEGEGDSKKAYWPLATDSYYSISGGTIYTTALACMSLEIAVTQYTPGSRFYVGGQLSYGYNQQLGQDRRQPTPDTIALMDYTRSVIVSTDPAAYIAPRHGGKANVIFVDGRVRALTTSDLTSGGATILTGLLTPVPGD